MKRAVGTLIFAALIAAGSRWDPAAQAQIGRTAWRNAIASLRAGDSSRALAQLRRAHEAWPAQPAYSEALVRLAARLGDAVTLTSTLDLLARQGIGAGATGDSAVDALAVDHPAVARALAQLRRVSVGPARSVAEIVSEDTTFFPEGLSLDARDGTRFVTSLKHRNVWMLGSDGRGRWLLPEYAEGRGAVFGAKLAADGRTLWLSLAATPHMGECPADSTVAAELWRVERSSGSVLQRLRLGDGKGIPGELALQSDGTVLVSDAVLGRLYRLRAGRDSLEIIESPLLRSPQGIAVLEDERVAIVADWSHGLLRWDLETDAITALETPSTMALLGIDGLLLVDGTLIAVQNGLRPNRVLRVTIDAKAGRVLRAETVDRPAEYNGEFTVAAALGHDVFYVASSAWPYWSDEGRRIPGSGELPPVLLRRFTLPE